MTFQLPRWLGDLLCLVAGAILPLAFAPFDWFPMAVLSIALFFSQLHNISQQRAFWRGWLYGTGMFGAGIYWIHISLTYFGGINLALAIILTGLFAMFMALFLGLFGWLAVRFFPTRSVWKTLAALPALWLLIEWVRSWFLTGFPWLLLGYSQLDAPLSGFAPLIGVYGISWLIVFSGAMLVYLVEVPRRALIAVPALIVIWGGGFALQAVQWTTPAGKTIDTVLVQGNIPQEFKWENDWNAETLNRYFKLSREHRDADLIIWPESAIPMFMHQADPVIEALTREQVRYNTDFLIGIPVYEFSTERAFNSALSLSEAPGIYDKRHLVPFGEYMPFRPVFGIILDFLEIPMSDFSTGDIEQGLLRAAGQPIGMAICYEIAYPGEVRRSLPEATVLANISNDAWFGDSIGPRQHLQIARMRALESGRYVLRATNTGISAIINENGKIIDRIPQFELAALRADVQPFSGATPYVSIGDWPFILLAFAVAIGAYFGVRGKVKPA